MLLGTLAIMAGCGESPTSTPGMPEALPAVERGNSPNAKLCHKNGWQGLVSSTGDSFSSEEECVAYAAQGGTLYRLQTITFGALAGKTFGDADFDVSATASSGLAVTFSASGDCTVSGATVHLTGAGSCIITAHQAGDATWYPAPDVSQSFAIAKGDQTIAYTSSAAVGLIGGPTYTPTATATSGLPVAITLDATSSGCSLAGGVVTFTGVGTCVIDANQAGDANWNPATQQQQSISVVACIGTEAALRAAAAAGGAFDFCSAGTTIVLTGGEVAVSTTLSLTGVGGSNAIVDANNSSRVFNVTGGNLTLRDVTVTGGRAAGDAGGGINASNSVVVLNGNTAVTNNAARVGGGVSLVGSLTMNDASTVSSNSAVDAAGGVFVSQPISSLTMNGTSTVRGNLVQGQTSSGGGLVINAATVTMNGSSAIRDNVAGPSGFPNFSYGGGIYFVNGGALTLNSSAVITGNAAANGGGGIYRIDGGIGTITGVSAANVFNNTPNNCAISFSSPPVPGCVP